MSPSDINYDLLRGGDAGAPPDGAHRATCVVAKLLDLDSGSKLVTEWQAVGGAQPYYWTTWHGFTATRISVTQEFLDGLGVERSAITDDAAFEAALANVQGVTYDVRTSAWSGGTNTFVDGVVVPVGADVPIDTSDLPVPAQTSSAAAADDDLPF